MPSNISSLLHTIGIYFFTKGFLLTRLVLDFKSECAAPPFDLGRQSPRTYTDGCWHPKVFDKAVIIIIDALRYDFTVPSSGDAHHHFHNALTVLDETARQSPGSSFLLPFIADPPTSTLQRLKGLTTGTLPTFIDIGSNFAGTAIEEDNLVGQLRNAGKTLVHLGDDTWHSLFPGYFDANLTHAYDSFNVWDLFTVDNGVTEHLIPLLSPENTGKWDILFGHYLGVDHAGHRYGPDHPATNSKLREMDDVLRKVITLLDDNTLLVVMGDHGMDVKGDHGGESDDEVEAALWMYSKKGVFGRGHNGKMEPPATAKERPVGQIDLVPTLSLLLGMPIPFNNLGAPIAEAFVGAGEPDWQKLASVNALTGAQISRYQHEYSRSRELAEGVFSLPQRYWADGLQYWKEAVRNEKGDFYATAFEKLSQYQQETLRIYRSLWTTFNILSMLQGILVLASTVAIMAVFARSSGPSTAEVVPVYLSHMTILGAISGAGVLLVAALLPGMVAKDASLLGLAAGAIAGFGWVFLELQKGVSHPFPRSLWGWLAVVFTLSQSVGFASNSYTIWEDEIMLCFLGTFAFVAFASSIRQEFFFERILGMSQAAGFLFLSRLASLSRLCREEQMPYCRSTYYASTNSSTSAPWQLLIPLITAILLPIIIKTYYQGTRSYQGPATLWVGFALRMGLLGSAIYWVLDAADDNEWLSISQSNLKMIKIVLARLILGSAFAVGTTIFVYGNPCINVEVTPGANIDTSDGVVAKPKSVKVFGYANVHGTRYFLLVTNWLLAIFLLQKPMGGGAIGILTIQILALLEIIDTNDLSQSAIGPVVLGLLGSFHFFKTGHQATLSSIQWESAFVALRTVTYPWSPLLVMLNAFGAQILTTVAVPLIALWKQSPKKPRLLSDVAKALATLLLYYAVINLATAMWAGWLRRHLMLYRIFSPRFMTAAAVLITVDMVGMLVTIGSLRWNFASIAEVFGWS